MLRRVRRFASTAAICAALGLCPVACEQAADEPPQIPAGTVATATDWSERLAEPSVADLLAALAQPHALVRARVGPHRLHTTADFTLGPEGQSATDTPSTAVDAPVIQTQQVHDELTLHWATTAEDDPRFSLSQQNDHERGREVVVIGEVVHVQLTHRGWFHYPRDSDIVELWLNDAQRAVHDVVQLAAPQLAITPETLEGEGLDGGAAVEFTLSLGTELDRSLVALGPTQGWRADAEIEAVTGTVRVDATSGAWLRADVDLRYGLQGADGRPQKGHVRLRSELQPGPPGEIHAPGDSTPLPARIRYDDQQRRLLDGLAAP